LSGQTAAGGPARSVELSVVAELDVLPWRYPPRLDFQYGDWLRAAFERGELEPWHNPDPDTAILLTTARARSRPLVGPSAGAVLPVVPSGDLRRAMLDELPSLMDDLAHDTRNVLLTLARILGTLETGEIMPKDVAAERATKRIPAELRPVLERARAIYLGEAEERWDDLAGVVRPAADRLVAAIEGAG
jgi:streptomycin 3"-adenylyltransferase